MDDHLTDGACAPEDPEPSSEKAPPPEGSPEDAPLPPPPDGEVPGDEEPGEEAGPDDNGLPTLPAGWIVRVLDVRRERRALRGNVVLAYRPDSDQPEQVLQTQHMSLGSDRERRSAVKAAVEALHALTGATTGRDDVARLRAYLSAVHAAEEHRAAQCEADEDARRAEPERVREALPDAPVPAEAIIPSRWGLSEAATVYLDKPDPLAAAAPIVITALLHDIDGGPQALEIAWARDGVWSRRVVDRGEAMDARRLVTHANHGLPVNSVRAPQLVSYLTAFEAANYRVVPRRRVATHLGWLGSAGQHGFLLGRTLILPNGSTAGEVAEAEAAPDDWREDWIGHRALSPGDAQLAAAYHPRGSMSAWLEAVSVLEAYPLALLDLYASFAAPLLQIFDAPNFVIDHAYRTSTGKTTCLRVAASVWGCPDEHADRGVIQSWDATKVYVERAASALIGIPLLLDDTKRAKVPAMVGEIIYLLANGRGRGRGSLSGMAETRAWRTILVSTGEAPATSFTTDGGARQRCIEITSPPFGEPKVETARLTSKLTLAVRGNYGHPGQVYVTYLLRNRDKWPSWREEYAGEVARLIEAAHSPEATRLAQYAAVLTMAAALANAACDLPWPYRDPLADVWPRIVEAAAEAPPEIRALHDILSWATAHSESFQGRERRDRDGQPIPPVGGWAGTWHKTPTFLRHVLRDILTRLDYQPAEVIPAWAERDWLHRDGRQATVYRRCWGERQRMYALTEAGVAAGGMSLHEGSAGTAEEVGA